MSSLASESFPKEQFCCGGKGVGDLPPSCRQGAWEERMERQELPDHEATISPEAGPTEDPSMD